MRELPKEEKPKTWRARVVEFFGAVQNAPRAFGLLWEADPRSATAMGVITLLGAGIPVSQAWVTKRIIDGVVGAMNRHVSPADGIRLVLPFILAEFALIFVGAVCGQFRQLLDKLISHRLGHLINTRIIRKALSLETRWFEDAAFYDKMQNARRQSEYRVMGIVNAGFLLVQNVLTLGSFLVVLVAYNGWVAAVLFGAAIPAFIVQCRYSQLIFRLETWRTPETRAMSYFEQLLTLDSTVKEVKLFRLGEPLLARYAKTFREIFDEDAKLARSRSFKSLAWGLLSTLTYYGAFLWIVGEALAGRTTIGGMTMYMTVFSQSQGTFQGLLDNLNNLYEHGLFLDNLFSFMALESATVVLDQKDRPAEDPSRGLEFEGVWFKYEGREEWALKDLTLTIGPAEKLALVGDNGAGKTTLIKLLTRLYEPVKGRILFRGVDLRYFSPAELHRRVGAIFQDFVHYHLPFDENVGFGSVENLGDAARIEAAAEKSGADDVARSLPDRYKTVLGRWFERGFELSGGQWQKIALGRAFMSDGEVLILDEPTSALDAGAEHDVFEKFKALTAGKIALLVSHRFSTVRMADRIAVLKAGGVSELGTHDELVARGGDYARLFELQAAGYR